MTNTSTLDTVERACAELLRNGQAVTFTAAAAAHRPGPGHSLPGHHDPRRNRGEPSRRRHQGHHTALTDEIATLRAAIDTLAASVRRHEEQLS
ncbi:hypothetical protein [Arthrobacter sp. M4]|uniref:hypothetical protein n=1 Tax=Arthrobacter sp. M4 TaxID=218160 RepID=UPI001CDC8ADA|nr:hypothetical protein [Arthrobacter sp. M4]MCA4132588.1 hypothetical protein [Arthrobacter sp. M4]